MALSLKGGGRAALHSVQFRWGFLSACRPPQAAGASTRAPDAGGPGHWSGSCSHCLWPLARPLTLPASFSLKALSARAVLASILRFSALGQHRLSLLHEWKRNSQLLRDNSRRLPSTACQRGVGLYSSDNAVFVYQGIIRCKHCKLAVHSHPVCW